MAAAKEQITQAYEFFISEMPVLAKLKLVIRVELRGRGDVQVYRAQTPGPEVTKVDPSDFRLDVSISRSHFNELVADGKLRDWHEAFDNGHVKVGGDGDIVKLLGAVVERQESRAQLKRAR